MAGERLSAEDRALVRAAVADAQEAIGLWEMARRTRAGEMDQLPAMQFALAAVDRVLEARDG